MWHDSKVVPSPLFSQQGMLSRSNTLIFAMTVGTTGTSSNPRPRYPDAVVISWAWPFFFSFLFARQCSFAFICDTDAKIALPNYHRRRCHFVRVFCPKLCIRTVLSPRYLCYSCLFCSLLLYWATTTRVRVPNHRQGFWFFNNVIVRSSSRNLHLWISDVYYI